MFDGRWRHAVDRTTKPVGSALVRVGITADVLTIFGLVMSVVTAFVVGSGHLVAGIFLLFPTGLPDLFDGPVAKASGRASVRGAFFDSVADRISDAFLFGGVACTVEELRQRHLRRRRKLKVPPVCMIDVFAIADFHKRTLVLRYSGKMCCKILQKRGLH